MTETLAPETAPESEAEPKVRVNDETDRAQAREGFEPMLDSEKKYCSECAEIQAADPLRHFKGCSQRIEREDAHQLASATREMIDECHSRGREIEVLREELRKALNRENVLNENLTSVQARCTELLKERRGNER